MNYSVSSFKVYIYKVNPDSWIIRALENNGYDLDYCLELDYTENPDNTREQLLGFYNYARTEYKDLKGYPEYK